MKIEKKAFRVNKKFSFYEYHSYYPLYLASIIAYPSETTNTVSLNLLREVAKGIIADHSREEPHHENENVDSNIFFENDTEILFPSFRGCHQHPHH